MLSAHHERNSQERKDDWLEKVLIQILAERARGCEEEGEKSLLLAAKHLVQCKNCDNTRLSNVAIFVTFRTVLI